MTTEERCGCCDLPTYSCGKAKETAQRHTQDAERRTLIRAGQRFDVDALIRYAGDGGWRAECCADGAP
ncbi:MAG: hypothetical protein ACRDSS_07935 [Actinocrinis sp.]